ncbi:DUF4352 domain-containing protein [Halalkalibacter akibai]|uniref:DUF4352 domain-containing protein n=1 Tax=Halalkalibacter akibai (strain ATCC 43226 / DSM 21942 / CIP 109018 / JCM 9157 / 1139) TaxID=1236973 RepID=W4QVS6_HALA3|nr:DUF4352 domain-containing protein [Halalkalibacter akibai]GAE35738.1 hypothetical protein JCM9157_2866 [Halalkalibacter akibai JCM 9157]
MQGKVVLLLSLVTCLLLLGGYYGFQYFQSGQSPALAISDSVEETIESKGSGDVRFINGIGITLNEVRVEEILEDEGNQIVFVDLQFDNERETVYEFSSYKITLVDKEGFAYSMDTSIETRGILGGQLHPGRTNRGEVAFVVPIGSEYELVYTDHLRTGQVTWQVTLDEE